MVSHHKNLQTQTIFVRENDAVAPAFFGHGSTDCMAQVFFSGEMTAWSTGDASFPLDSFVQLEKPTT